MKKYRVNESEHFNLYSMHDKLKCIEIDMQEAPAHTYTDEQWDEVQERISEVEELMEKAYCVGALVDWPTLKRIREIKEERQLMRYNACMEQGASEKEKAEGDTFWMITIFLGIIQKHRQSKDGKGT